MGNIASVLSISLVKLSILKLYHRVFASAIFRRWVIIVAVTCLMWAIACGLAATLHCIPPAKLWKPTLKGHCIDWTLYFEIVQPINVAQEFIIAFMPIPIINSLQLQKRQKIFICFLFLLGNLYVSPRTVSFATK